ncbi:MAG: hypothetical protein AAGH19_07240 [Pseudomonadota bacterium]
MAGPDSGSALNTPAGAPTRLRSPNAERRHRRAQLIKWTVYTLLLLNGAFYLIEEIQMAAHTLKHGASLYEWTEAFATTIDNLAWYGLLLMFELETYVLEDEAWERPWVTWTLHGVRLLCYAMLLHTVVARTTSLNDAWTAPPLDGVTSVCQVAEDGLSWGYNFEYEEITSENCGEFSSDSSFYRLDPLVISDREGLAMEKKQTAVDLSDALVWLLVIWAIELAVWLQNRNITGGTAMAVSHAARFLYLVLFGHAIWWIYTGHYVYAWDQTLWILGFWAIERNLSEWREEIVGDSAAHPAPLQPSDNSPMAR